ncbi:MAG: hypothetical protein WC284_12435 [Candidimonas sp.]
MNIHSDDISQNNINNLLSKREILMVSMPRDSRGTSVPVLRPLMTQVISFEDASVQSSSINSQIIRVVCNENCHIAIGEDPTATENSMLIPAGTHEYFVITPGDKIAALRESNNGKLFITSMS